MPEHPDLQDEQEFLNRAYDGLEFMRGEARQMLQGVLDLGRGGTFQSRTERDIVVRTSLARLEQLDIGDQALYFGRIDRLPDPDEGGADGTALGESFHIGRLAVSGPDHEPLVVDWRAPVAEPFYRATGLDPQGLARRRHLSVRGRTVLGLEDEYFVDPDGRGTVVAAPGVAAGAEGHGEGERLLSDGMVLGGPGALLSALGQARTGHMGDIIGTIQREQDEIIRSPLAGVLVVQGGPGTGKTAVALHRAAYLLYTHRFPLERQGVLVVGPNPLFLRYIEQVLPSLGETGVSLSTVAGLVPEVRVRGVDDSAVAKLKGDVRMVKVLARAVRTRQRPLRRDAEIPFGAGVLRLRASVTEDIVAMARRRPAPTTRAAASSRPRCCARCPTSTGPQDAAGTNADEPAEPGGTERPGAAAAPGPRGGRGARPDVAAPVAARIPPRPLRRPAAAGGRRPGDPDQRGGAAALPAPQRLARRRALDGGRHRPHRRGPHAARPPPRAQADRVRAQRNEEAAAQEGGFWPQGLATSPVPVTSPASGSDDEIRSFGHIVVDEVQDLSPMQLRMLARRSLSGSMTVVGDIAQATGPWAPQSWDDVTRHLSPQRPPRLVELTVSYRTPSEVVALAARVLAVAAPVHHAAAPGAPVGPRAAHRADVPGRAPARAWPISPARRRLRSRPAGWRSSGPPSCSPS